MYLARLYKQNKSWFVFILLFMLAQLVIDVKQGVVISPFFHYGMYAGVIQPQQQYMVTEIYVDGNKLQPADFSPYEWDKITLPIERFPLSQSSNMNLWNSDIKRLTGFSDSSVYMNRINTKEFNSGYKTYLAGMLGKKIDSVAVIHTLYGFDGYNLTQQP